MPRNGKTMGKWHRPYQIALIIKKIQHDISPKKIYEYEKSMGWTNANTLDHFWFNTKERIYKLTGKSFLDYIKPNTISYINHKKYWYWLEENMAKNIVKELYSKNFKEKIDKLDKEDLLIIIESYKEVIKELEDELNKKKQERNKIKAKLVYKTKNKFKAINKRFYIERVCLAIGIPKRTFNDQYKKQNILSNRKLNVKAKCNSPLAISRIVDCFMNNYGVYGIKRVYEELVRNGTPYHYWIIRKTLRTLGLYANEVKVNPKFYEIKDTSIKKEYIPFKESLNNFKKGELFSIDFTEIQTKFGRAWLHGAVDIVTREILFIFLCFDQKKETVLKHYKYLPSSTKAINTDYGSSYLSKDVQEYLESRNIKQSLGRVGVSYDNRWIENLWKRLKYEWLSIYPLDNCCYHEIKIIIKNYINYYNNQRLTKIDGVWVVPSIYARNFI